MGYQIIPVTTNVVKQNIALGIALNFNAPAVFTSVFSSDVQILNNLKNLLLTRIGERYENPLFGTNLLSILFQPNTFELKEDITDIITIAVNRWLPEIIINKIDIVTAEDDPLQEYDVNIAVTFQSVAATENTINIQASENGILVVS
jgi:phage baseplate assembly protein W